MAANEHQLNKIQVLRHLELRLLRCSLPSDHTSPPPSPTQSSPDVSSLSPLIINDIITLIESGQYVQALSSSASQILFSSLQFSSCESAQRFYSESLPQCANSFLDVNEESWEETAGKALLVVAVGVAALLAFTQCNVTGSVSYFLHTTVLQRILFLGRFVFSYCSVDKSHKKVQRLGFESSMYKMVYNVEAGLVCLNIVILIPRVLA